MKVAGERAAEPGDERDDVVSEPSARDELGRDARRELTGTHAQLDPLAQAREERPVDRVAHAPGRRPGEHQLAHEDARELRLRRVEREEHTEDVLGLVCDAASLRQRLERSLDGAIEAVLEDERDEILLGAGVEEERPLRDSRALRDGARRRRVEPALDEERRRGLADPRPLVGLVRLAAHE